jgi:L-asparaginase
MMNSYRPLHIIATGGTIDKVYNLAGELEIGKPAADWLLAQARVDIVQGVFAVVGKDSLAMTDDDRFRVAEAVGGLPDSGVVITHGTDTMAETADYLAQGDVLPSGTTVVLTGAMQPAVMRDSDALFNLGSALTAAQILAPGVFIAMNGRIFPSGQVGKDRETGIFRHHQDGIRSDDASATTQSRALRK